MVAVLEVVQVVRGCLTCNGYCNSCTRCYGCDTSLLTCSFACDNNYNTSASCNHWCNGRCDSSCFSLCQKCNSGCNKCNNDYNCLVNGCDHWCVGCNLGCHVRHSCQAGDGKQCTNYV